MITCTTVLAHHDGDAHLTITGTPSQVEYLQARIRGMFSTQERSGPSLKALPDTDAANFAALFATLRRDR